MVSTLEQGLFVLGPTVERPALEEGGDDGTRPGKGNGPPDQDPGKG